MTDSAKRILHRIRCHPGIGRSGLLDALARSSDRALGRRTAEGLDLYVAELLRTGRITVQRVPPPPQGGQPKQAHFPVEAHQ